MHLLDDLPCPVDRPWIYANFVMTLDGKVSVTSAPESYWPLGSELDFQELIHLRTQSDILVHGRKTAQVYRALNRLEDEGFQQRRRAFCRSSHLPYAIVSGQADKNSLPFLSSSQPIPTYLLTVENTEVPESFKNVASVVRMGESLLDVKQFIRWCSELGYKRVLIEGGPALFQLFLEAGYMDDLFLTLTPKLVGGNQGQTKTLLDDGLFSLEQIKRGRLVSCRQVDDELFLHYRLTPLP